MYPLSHVPNPKPPLPVSLTPSPAPHRTCPAAIRVEGCMCCVRALSHPPMSPPKASTNRPLHTPLPPRLQEPSNLECACATVLDDLSTSSEQTRVGVVRVRALDVSSCDRRVRPSRPSAAPAPGVPCGPWSRTGLCSGCAPCWWRLLSCPSTGPRPSGDARCGACWSGVREFYGRGVEVCLPNRVHGASRCPSPLVRHNIPVPLRMTCVFSMHCCWALQVQHPDGRLTPFIRLVPIWQVCGVAPCAVCLRWHPVVPQGTAWFRNHRGSKLSHSQSPHPRHPALEHTHAMCA
jgi:hypothetical protein